MHRPEQWSALRANFDRLARTAVEKILRWTSSATQVLRTATRDTEIASRRIVAGDRAVLWLTSADRDDDEFVDADVFDVARTPNRHLALGGGPYYCIGNLLAGLEIRAVLRELTTRVHEVRPDGPSRRLDSIVVNGLSALLVRLVTDVRTAVPA